jgi:protein-tyrosine phosphatase
MLNQRLKKERIRLKVLPGMEVALDPGLPDALDHGKLQTLGETSYLLIETPYQMLPLGWQQILFAIASMGYAVLLAHPERCAQLAENAQMIDALLELDIYLQVNWDSFLGYQGRDTARLARDMATKGCIHCLATDSHDPRNRSPASVERAGVEVERFVGSQNLELLAKENPARVLRNKVLVAMRQLEIRVKSGKKGQWLPWLRKL